MQLLTRIHFAFMRCMAAIAIWSDGGELGIPPQRRGRLARIIWPLHARMTLRVLRKQNLRDLDIP